jgi:hypothetical protein
MTSRAVEATATQKYAGASIVEMMEWELDKARAGEDGEYALGLATAVAIIRTPYSYLGKHPAPPFIEMVDVVLDQSAKRNEEKIRLAAEKAKEK